MTLVVHLTLSTSHAGRAYWNADPGAQAELFTVFSAREADESGVVTAVGSFGQLWNLKPAVSTLAVFRIGWDDGGEHKTLYADSVRCNLPHHHHSDLGCVNEAQLFRNSSEIFPLPILGYSVRVRVSS